MFPFLTGFAAGDCLHCLQDALPPAQVLWTLLLASLLALALLCASRIGPRTRGIALLLLALVLGLSQAGLRARQRLQDQLPEALEGQDLAVQGFIATLPSRQPGWSRFVFVVDPAIARTQHMPGRLSLAWYRADAPVHPDDRWAFTVRLRSPQATANPGAFDAEAYLFAQGVRAVGYVRDGPHDPAPRPLQERQSDFNATVDRVRDALRGRLQAALGGARYGAVIVALVMGDQGPIDEGDWLLFNRTGISHLVSISGLHITMIASLVALACAALWRRSAWLLRRAGLPVVRALAAIVGGLLYCLLAGWGVPAQRTLLMLAVVAGAQCLRVRPPARIILSAAAALVCLWDPWAPLAAGFWLSFGAVACIFLAGSGSVPAAAPPADGPSKPPTFGPAQAPGHVLAQAPAQSPSQAPAQTRPQAPALVRWRRRLRAQSSLLRETARLQAAITIGQVPLTIAIFGQVSLAAPLANAVAIPLVSFVVTPLALAGAALAALAGAGANGPSGVGMFSWFDPIARLLLWGSERCFAALARLLELLASQSWAFAALPPPPWPLLAIALAGITWLLLQEQARVRLLGFAWMLPLACWPAAHPAAGTIWATALDVGQGMAVLLEGAGRRILFDTGPRYSPDADAGSRVLVPYLSSRGIGQLDLMVVSHPDIDHAGGARSVFSSLAVDRLLTSVPPGHPLLRGGPAPQRCEAGQRLALGPWQIEVLSPDASLYDDPRATTNARSCVIRATLGGHSLLLTGDVPARQERGMVARFAPRALVLMLAPHHGSHTSSSAELLDWARPRFASMQVGYRNRFGHPHDEVLERYSRRGICVLRSDASGAVQWRIDAAGAVAVERWRIDHRRYWTHQMTEAGSGGNGRCDAPFLPPGTGDTEAGTGARAP